MYAIIETGGKQYQVSVGDEIFVEKLDAEAESSVTIDKVIAVGKEDGMVVGAPYVDGASVSATVVKNGKGKKEANGNKGNSRDSRNSNNRKSSSRGNDTRNSGRNNGGKNSGRGKSSGKNSKRRPR